jgi:hypothetical protein
MSKGMEMMMGSLIKMAGIDPNVVVEQFKGAQDLLVSSVKNFDERLSAIEIQQRAQNDLLREILIKLSESK